MKDKQGFITLNLTKTVSDVSPSDMNKIHSAYIGTLRNCLEKIKYSAQEKTPVKTGRLKRGFRIITTGFYPRIIASVVNPVPYFSFIENGRKVALKRNIERKRVQPNIPTNQKDRINGVRMLQRSIEEHRSEINSIENDFTEEFLSLIKTKKV